jgi:hypothetical protein
MVFASGRRLIPSNADPAAARGRQLERSSSRWVHAPPLAEGSRIKMVPSLEREKDLLRGGPKTRGLLRLPVRVERPRDVFNPSLLSVRWVPGVASYRAPSQQTVCLRRHPIDLKTQNATPLRARSWSRATCCYVAWVDAYGQPPDHSAPAWPT